MKGLKKKVANSGRGKVNLGMELPELTVKEQKFVDCIIEHGMTDRQAFEISHQTKSTNEKSIGSMIWKLKKKKGVSRWLAQARIEGLIRAVESKTEHLETLSIIRDQALEKEAFQAAAFAEVNRGKACGYYVERVEVNVIEDPLSIIAKIAKHSPELAERMAIEKGISFDASKVIDAEKVNITSIGD